MKLIYLISRVFCLDFFNFFCLLCRSTAFLGQKMPTCVPPGPENAGPWPTRAEEKSGPKIMGLYKVVQYICPFLYSTIYQFLRGLEGSHRLTTQKVPGSNLGPARKNIFFFFQFFPGLSQNINKTQSWFSRYAHFFWQK